MNISIVIRNKNQAKDLEILLSVLYSHYKGFFDEVILVDNLSSDNSLEVAARYGVKIINLEKFSFGGAVNAGVAVASNEIVVLFSPHVLPVGRQFFTEISREFDSNEKLAGLRFISNTKEALTYYNQIDVHADLYEFGIVSFCSAIRKSAWELIPFSDYIITSEDKHWSCQIVKAGYSIQYLPVSYVYTKSRGRSARQRRLKNEIVASWLISQRIESPSTSIKNAIFSIAASFRNILQNIYEQLDMAFYKCSIYLKRKRLMDEHIKSHLPSKDRK